MSALLDLPGKILGGIGNVVGSVVGTLFGGGSPLAQAAPPVVAPPPVMPLPDDKAALIAKKKGLADQIKSRGRASTILTADGTLGSPPEPLG